MTTAFPHRIVATLDRFREAGRTASFWLRDDDAVAPTPALEQLLHVTERYEVPLALAVIPQPTGPALADRLAEAAQVSVLVHGWRHADHAKGTAKKRELGPDRPAAIVLGELADSFAKLKTLHSRSFAPVLVPPWNRIDAALLPHLRGLGFEALSVYGPERPGALREINTQIDVMDWHGTRGCRDWTALEDEIVVRMEQILTSGLTSGESIGLLTHHLVHDAAVWSFLDRLFDATVTHPAGRWVGIPRLLTEIVER